MNVFTEEKICLLFLGGLAGAAAAAVPFPTVFGGPQQSLPTENQSTLGGVIVSFAHFTPVTGARGP